MSSHHIILGEAREPSQKHPPGKPDGFSKQAQKKQAILIVEDELLVAENIKELLLSAGYAIAGICSSGEEVLEHFLELNPDLILMDIRLAGPIDGIRTAYIIQEKLKAIPILFLTAYGEELIPELEDLKSNLFDLLTKPYDKVQIIQSVANLLTRAQHNKD